MSESRPLVGIDVGSHVVSVVVAEPDSDELVVLGCGQAWHDGAPKSSISDLQEVSAAVRNAALEAEAMADVPVEHAVVGIGGTPMKGRPARASVPVTGRDHRVTAEDQHRALAGCARIDVPGDYRVLDVIPCGFSLDGQLHMNRPIGMTGERLDASAFVLYTHKTHAETVEQAVNLAGVSVSGLVFEPLAAAEAVLIDDEKKLGCLLLDIGYGSSEWVLFSEGIVMATGATPVAGRVFTNDLAVILKTTTTAAEQVKKEVGALAETGESGPQAVEVPALGSEGQQVFPSQLAADILRERARDLLVRTHKMLAAEALDKVPRAGIVLTGGGARLEGLVPMAEEILGQTVRIGAPRGVTGLTEPVSGPEWAVACGLILHQQRGRCSLETPSRGGGLGFMSRIRQAFGEIFELGGGP